MNLRTQVMRGGTYLAVRQGIGMLLSIGGVLLITRIIGPENYGLYASAIGIYVFIQIISQLGISPYLVRGSPNQESFEAYHQASTLLFLIGCVGSIVALAFVPLIQSWVRLEGFSPIATALFLELPIALTNLVPLAKLERELNYKRVAMIELANQIVYFGVATPLAIHGAGAWSLVIGWWVQELQGLLLFNWGAGYRPRWVWQPKLVKEMLSYSFGFSAAQWIYHLRTLVSPMIVGRFLGPESVGFVSLVIRLAEVLSFVKNATWRISIAALARIQSDKGKLRHAITEGMGLQLLALGPMLVGVAWLLPWIIRTFFGDRWLPAVEVFPFVAFAYLTNTMFNLHSSTLFVLQKNWQVARFHVVHVALFAGTAILLVPKIGLIGYGWAEVVAFASYAIVHFYVSQQVGQPNYQLAILWWAAFGSALFVRELGWWVVLGIVGVAFLPSTYKQLQSYVHSFRGNSV